MNQIQTNTNKKKMKWMKRIKVIKDK